MDNRIAPPILAATMLAGTFDICAAFLQSALTRGVGPVSVLHSVASGVFDKDAAESGGLVTALFGLVLHFSIMAIMVTVFVLAARRLPMLTAQPWLWGPLYGVALWCVMYLIVLPTRFPGFYAFNNPLNVALQLSFHVFLVGLTIALVTARYLRR